MPAPQHLRNEDNKPDRIIKAALEVFAEHGLHGTPVPPIARKAGVGVGTLYRYFENKEALVNAVFRDTKQRLKDHLTDGVDLNEPSRALFNELWDRLTGFARQNPAAFRFLEMQDHHAYLDNDSWQIERSLLVPMGMMILQGQQNGLLNPQLRADIAIALFWGGFVGIFKAEAQGYLTIGDSDLLTARDACWQAIRHHPKSEGITQ
ncbi:TetR family transcriptional regulator [Tamilnaduibacter salinus]|uniref:TetR family transcriptional regulator n=1 Tax=Tamilnaduibacter salinus TaxID=1484056 RepID=A0A2U1CZC3_9GAMM|nr:TetR/AcrR family transcriptional regulator [Tamilnaduibacter salinus]PVY78127.1 TetR family transcriptional regulator [Tamilnaduibacter salinus]